MFQAWVGLKDAKFSFDTAWPTITDLQLDLLFENERHVSGFQIGDVKWRSR
uniref:YhdP family protein n=1 Tax=Serratia marcescens TaxID=615 RepID=UPI0038B40AE1